MRAAALREFLAEQMQDAKASGLLFSVHLKATMMKVSDPIIFGHAVTTFFPELIGTPGWNPNDGLGALPAGTEIPYRRQAGAGDGRLGPRHHQPARAERRDHRRLDAGGDPRLRTDVEPAGRSSRTPSS